jgi:hypothetical protein
MATATSPRTERWSSLRNKEDRKMRLLTPEETRFLDVFLHEATTAPFTGSATKVLHDTGIEYGDISYIAWAYEQDLARTGFAVGHAADAVPPLPWSNRQSALRRTSMKVVLIDRSSRGYTHHGGTADLRPGDDS